VHRKEKYSFDKLKVTEMETTGYVLDETFTLLFRRLPFKEAKDSLDVIELAIKEGERHKNEVSGQANK